MKVNISWIRITSEESGKTSATSNPQRWRLSVEADGTFFFTNYPDVRHITPAHRSALWEVEF